MFTGALSYPSGDLNLIVAQKGFALMHVFLIEHLAFHQISAICHRALSHVVRQFSQYAKDDQIITLSTPKPGMHVLHVILSACSTADMVLMTPGRLACFYLQWLAEGITVVRHTGHDVQASMKLGVTIGCQICVSQNSVSSATHTGRSSRASCGAKPHVVPVPVQEGVVIQPTVYHLDVNYWVKQYSLGVYMTASKRL
ncbi:hypothetical protein EV702DRAFT_1044512 [Suillus placidus]|uniref:Uncharacterized protein n=1 Tax=Suillus placidus TaxID=48579 RepID=A0A9P6ZY00_9AGAM|nr:hypothetical protein EV702DRAFT_1044512 [Suillus placidus]